MSIINLDNISEIELLTWKLKILEDKYNRTDRANNKLIKALSFYADVHHIQMSDGQTSSPYTEGCLHLDGTWLQAPDYDVYHDTEDGSVARSALYEVRKLLG